MTDCVFCRIASGDLPAKVVARSDAAVAFHDLNPQAPVHVLVIPRLHLSGANQAVGAEGGAAWAGIMDLALRVAREMGVADSGYRIVVNQGGDGGQSVDHLHAHLLGARQLKWPPG